MLMIAGTRGIFWRIYAALVAVLIPVVLCLAGVRLLLTDLHLQVQYSLPGFPEDPYGFTREDRLKYGPVALHYLIYSAEDLSYLTFYTLPNGDWLYTGDEARHLEDVRIVVGLAMLVLIVTGPLLVVLIAIGIRSRAGRKWLRRGMLAGGLIVDGVLVALLLYLVVDWDNFFDTFHNLFFAPGTWQFAYSSGLIRLYPVVFWQNAAIALGVFCAVGAQCFAVIALMWGRRASQAGRA